MLSEQSESASSRPDTAERTGTVLGEAARPSGAGEKVAAETAATGHKPASGQRKHWLDYATAFLTLAAAGGALVATMATPLAGHGTCQLNGAPVASISEAWWSWPMAL